MASGAFRLNLPTTWCGQLQSGTRLGVMGTGRLGPSWTLCDLRPKAGGCARAPFPGDRQTWAWPRLQRCQRELGCPELRGRSRRKGSCRAHSLCLLDVPTVHAPHLHTPVITCDTLLCTPHVLMCTLHTVNPRACTRRHAHRCVDTCVHTAHTHTRAHGDAHVWVHTHTCAPTVGCGRVSAALGGCTWRSLFLITVAHGLGLRVL